MVAHWNISQDISQVIQFSLDIIGQVILKALINSKVNYEHWKQNWQEKYKFQR